MTSLCSYDTCRPLSPSDLATVTIDRRERSSGLHLKPCPEKHSGTTSHIGTADDVENDILSDLFFV